MTDMAKSSRAWDRDTGVIDHDQKMLGGRLSDLHGPTYYSAGPPAMVAAMREMLLKAGVDEDDGRAEDVAGY
jgi:Na+-transporting NADH:ubiquinone oxidoreductase subunit NqrF